MQIVVKIDEQTYEVLKKIRERYGIPMTQTIKRAVARYVKSKGL